MLIVLASTVENAHETTSWVKSEGFKKREIKNNLKKINAMRTKTLYRCDAQKIDISRFPNFHITGSITGMKKLYYGKNALLVHCGSWIYNVSSEPEVYYNIAH